MELFFNNAYKKYTLRLLDTHNMDMVSRLLDKRVEVEHGEALKELERLNNAQNPSIRIRLCTPMPILDISTANVEH